VEDVDYEIDGQDRLAAVAEAWLVFARESRAPELTREAVIGRPIWHFITGASTRTLYELAFGEVRSADRRLALPLRCDSPDRRRFMELVLEPRADRAIGHSCRLLREEVREPQPLLDPSAPRSSDVLRACSWCKRLQGRDGHWREIEAAIQHGDLLGEPPVPQLSHAVCDDCRVAVRRLLRPDRS